MEIKKITGDNFQTEVTEAGGPVLVDFYTDWCGPCKAQHPVQMYANGARHMCAVCKRTELDDPNLEFRYCSKCNGNHEYCQEHLFTHTHIK